MLTMPWINKISSAYWLYFRHCSGSSTVNIYDLVYGRLGHYVFALWFLLSISLLLSSFFLVYSQPS